MEIDLNKSRAFTGHLGVVKKRFAPSYRFNLSRSGTLNGTLDNSGEIRSAVIPWPVVGCAGVRAFACVPKNDESYG